MIGISPRQLEVFAAIAAAGSARAAADVLHLTQPAISMALAELEKHLDAPLFARERGRLHLNERGRELLPLAQEILERLQEMQGRAGTGPRPLTGTLRVGASNTVGNYRVGELLGGFVRAYPKVSVRLVVDNTRAVLAGMRRHELDVGCVEGTAAHAELETWPWRGDDLVVCASPDPPLARRKRLRGPDFAGARWILREPGSAMRAQCERVLAALPAGETVLELGQVEAIKQAVIAGMGLACLPEVAVGDAVAAGRLVLLHTPFLDLGRRLSLVLARNTYHGTLVQAFMDTLTP